ncbi:MAG: hypothetical protein QM831_35975 [Kofleriaceae bacterium]
MDLEALAREPSPESWRLLCQGLDKLSVPEAQAAIVKLEPLLATWQDELRATMCGMTWDDEFFAGQPNPRSSIVRHLRFDRIFSGRYDHSMRMRTQLIVPAIASLAAAEGTQQLTMINLSYQLDDAGVAALARAQNFHALKELAIASCGIRNRSTLEALASAPFYGQLDKLTISSSEITGTQVSALFPAARPKELRLGGNPLGFEGATANMNAIGTTPIALELSDCDLSNASMLMLAMANIELTSLDIGNNIIDDPGFETLFGRALRAKSLTASQNAIGARGVQALVDADWPLESLDLSDNALDDDAAIALAGRGPASLTDLNLADNDITAIGLARLIGSDRLANLTSLGVGTNRISSIGELTSMVGKLESLNLAHNRLGDGIRSLAAIESESLTSLDLASNVITIRAFEELTGAAWFSRLTYLNLSGNALGPAAGVVFGPWTALKRLVLARTELGDEGVQALCGAGLALEYLQLDHCGLGDAALEAIAASSYIHTIEELSISDNAITARGVAALLAAKPKRLVQLRIGDNRIDDDAAEQLARWDQLLHVAVDEAGPKSKAALAKRPVRCCP